MTNFSDLDERAVLDTMDSGEFKALLLSGIQQMEPEEIKKIVLGGLKDKKNKQEVGASVDMFEVKRRKDLYESVLRKVALQPETWGSLQEFSWYAMGLIEDAGNS